MSAEILVLGVSHKTAAVAVRERLALPAGRARELLGELVAHPSVREAASISTCNRSELYLVATDPVEAESAALAAFSRQAGIRPTELTPAIYSLRNCDAARHLFRVTAGLESMVVGEAEVQGQVKRAWDSALVAGTAGPMLDHLFRAALTAGKRVRTETAIGEGHASVSSVAVAAAREALGGELRGRSVVLVGAGETSELCARALAEQGADTVLVANRRRDRAESLARRFGGMTAGFDELPERIESADIVLAATGSPHAIIGFEEIAAVMRARPGRPLLLVDLAVPRDIEADCGDIPGVTLQDVDSLQAVVARNRSVRAAESRKAESVLEEEIQRFAAWLGSLEVRPTIAALRAHGDDVARRVLAENEGRWEGLTDRDRVRLEAMARAIVSRTLSEPTQRLKRLQGDRAHARLQVVRELFGLDEEPVAAEPEGELAEVRELPRRRARQSPASG